MSKVLRNKGLLIFIITFSVIVSSLNIYRAIFYKNLSIFQNEQTITIAFNNGKYISVRPVADSITDSKTKTINPFGEFNDYTFTTTGLTIGPFSNAYTLNLKNPKAATTITAQQIGSSSVNLKYETTSDYSLGSTYKYKLEIDYSGLSKYSNDLKNVSLADNECSISTPVSADYEISNFSDGRSLLFAKQYENELEFNINLNINCNEN